MYVSMYVCMYASLCFTQTVHFRLDATAHKTTTHHGPQTTGREMHMCTNVAKEEGGRRAGCCWREGREGKGGEKGGEAT